LWKEYMGDLFCWCVGVSRASVPSGVVPKVHLQPSIIHTYIQYIHTYIHNTYIRPPQSPAISLCLSLSSLGHSAKSLLRPSVPPWADICIRSLWRCGSNKGEGRGDRAAPLSSLIYIHLSISLSLFVCLCVGGRTTLASAFLVRGKVGYC
jgi:hypothetical protein